MVSLVLDTNCIIELEEQRSDATTLSRIINAWREGRIDLAVVAISASENQRGLLNETYDQFLKKIEAVGLGGASQLLPPLFFDVTFWDASVFADDDGGLDEKLRDVLFPGMVLEAPKEERELRKWRNNLCDIYVAWSCIYHKWGTLVTRDENYHKKSEALAGLGLKVLWPAEAAELCMP